MGRIIHVNTVIAQHLVLHGYGHWLPNDLRGSGSRELRQEKLAEFGPIHFGRKWEQPPLAEVKAFYRDTTSKLAFEPIWFSDEQRYVIGEAFGSVVRKLGYTVWSCAVMHGHAHINPRIHRDDARTMWIHFAEASRDAIRKMIGVPDHPV
jgi:hypothetical protein